MIVVDDGSDDGTAVYLHDISDGRHIRSVRQPHVGPAAARNAAVQIAYGELLAFIDDDCQAAPDWLAAIAAAFRNLAVNSIGAVGGAIIPAPHSGLIHQFYGAIGRIHPQHKIAKPVETIFSCNMALPRSLLADLDGFDVSFLYPGGEDLDISYRLKQLGYILWFEPQVIVEHQYPTTISGLSRHFWHHGFGMATVFRKWPCRFDQQLSQKGHHFLRRWLLSRKTQPTVWRIRLVSGVAAAWQSVLCLGHIGLTAVRLPSVWLQVRPSQYKWKERLLFALLSFYATLWEQAGFVTGTYWYTRWFEQSGED